jgi:hypothetical protein
MTSPSHGGGPEFESQRAHFFFYELEALKTSFSSALILASRLDFVSGCTTFSSQLSSSSKEIMYTGLPLCSILKTYAVY